MSGALIVTAELGAADFARLEDLRQRHYPAERNQVAAHLTIIRALPPSAETETRRRLSEIARGRPPKALLAGVMDLGGGTALRVVSDELDLIREQLVEGLHGLLSSQDMHGWAPHVTIQNKVEAREARALRQELMHSFEPRPLAIVGLGLHHYLAGPWERIGIYKFRGA